MYHHTALKSPLGISEMKTTRFLSEIVQSEEGTPPIFRQYYSILLKAEASLKGDQQQVKDLISLRNELLRKKSRICARQDELRRNV